MATSSTPDSSDGPGHQRAAAGDHGEHGEADDARRRPRPATSVCTRISLRRISSRVLRRWSGGGRARAHAGWCRAPATRSATGTARPSWRSAASGSASSHGTSTKARSWARGCGRVSRAQVGRRRRCRRPGRRTARGRGRGCARPTAPRGVRSKAASSACSSRSSDVGRQRGAGDDDGVDVGGLLGPADRVGVVQPGRRPRR